MLLLLLLTLLLELLLSHLSLLLMPSHCCFCNCWCCCCYTRYRCCYHHCHCAVFRVIRDGCSGWLYSCSGCYGWRSHFCCHCCCHCCLYTDVVSGLCLRSCRGGYRHDVVLVALYWYGFCQCLSQLLSLAKFTVLWRNCLILTVVKKPFYTNWHFMRGKKMGLSLL